MKIKFLIITLFVFPYFLLAQDSFLLSGRVVNTNFTDTVSFEFQAHKVIVPVLLGGKIRCFILDTGAPLVVSKKLQEELQLEKLRTALVRDVNEQSKETDFVKINELQIGKVVFQDLTAAVSDFEGNLLACFGVEGLIGSNMLKNTIININTRRKEIILTDQKDFWKSKEQYAQPLILTKNQQTPIITIFPFKKASEKVILDLGSDDFYALSNRNFQFFKEKIKIEKYVIAEGRGASTIGLYGIEKDTLSYLLKLPELKINQTLFANAEAVTTIDENSRIGAKILDCGSVVVDYLYQRFYFIPFEEKKEIIIANDNWGLLLKPEKNQVKVGLVWSGSEAYKKGIRANDIVKKINNYDLENKPLCELLFQVKKELAEQNTLLLTLISQGGKQKQIYLSSRFLLFNDGKK
jgi:hypothetical protein